MPVRIDDQRGHPSRRGVLRAGIGLAALGLPGCGLIGDEPEPPAGPDPLVPLLAGVRELISRYDAALSALPELGGRLTAVREAHVAHAAELTRLIGAATPTAPTDAPATGSPGATGDVAGVLAALRAAEQAGRRVAFDACLAAPAERAALLGSIAAARASHVEALR